MIATSVRIGREMAATLEHERREPSIALLSIRSIKYALIGGSGCRSDPMFLSSATPGATNFFVPRGKG